MKQNIYMIVAVSKNGVIGNKNTIPWNDKEDMKFFKKTTEKHCLLMGKNTWLSLPKKPLQKRVHFIVSKHLCSNIETMLGVSHINTLSVTHTEDYPIVVFHNILQAIQYWKDHYASYKDLFIAGGGKVYESMLNEYPSFLTGVYCTHIKKNIEGDTYFPLQKMMQLSKNVIPIFSNKDIDICFYEF